MAYLTPGVYVEEKSSGEKPIAGVGTGTGGFVGVTEKGPMGKATLITSATQYASIFGGYVSGWATPYAVEQFFKEGGSKCYVVRTAHYSNIATNATTAVTGSVTITDGATTDVLKIEASSAGAWGNSLSFVIAAPTTGTLVDGFNLTISLGGTELGAFEDLTLDDLSAVEAVEDVVLTSLVTGTNPPPAIGTYAFGDAGAIVGDDGLTGITEADFKGSAAPAAKNGIYAMDPIDAVNMIAIPDIHFISGIDDARLSATIADGVSYCENRKDCFFIGDVPLGKAPLDARDFKTVTSGISSSYGAIYYPWIESVFGINRIMLPPSGAVMGMISRTDTARGVFKAPAGIIDGKLRSAAGIEYKVNHKEQESLNPKGINVIRNFSGAGNVVWGARTFAAGVDAEWHYINVRRYFMYVEESLDEGSQWVVFEPNTPALWGNVKRNFTAFLTNEWRNGALFGSTPEEAFYVKVDAENNPPSVRNLGQLIIEIGIAPVKPAEFVIIRISQKTLTS